MNQTSFQPRVTVVIPAYNSEATLADCIRAARAQRYPRETVEILVVDNNSTDRTKDIIEEHDVKYVFEPNRGRSQARNAGVANSSGELIAFIDSDACVAADWLEKIVPYFSDPHIGAVQPQIKLMTENPKSLFGDYRLYRSRMSGHNLCLQLIAWLPLVDTCSCVYRKKALDGLDGPFDEALVRAEDVDLSWKVIYEGYGLRYSDATHSEARYFPESVVHYLARAFKEGWYTAYLHKKWKRRVITFSRELRPAIPKRSDARAFLFGWVMAWITFSGTVCGYLLRARTLPDSALPVIRRAVQNARAGVRLSDDIRLIFGPRRLRIVRLRDGASFLFNETGNMIAERLLTDSLDEIAGLIARTFQIPREEAERDVDEFVRQLIDEDIVRSSGS